jgi:hypothetical protein
MTYNPADTRTWQRHVAGFISQGRRAGYLRDVVTSMWKQAWRFHLEHRTGGGKSPDRALNATDHHRHADSGDYNAVTGGFEYTFIGIGESVMDLGLLAEYLYDDRSDEATTPFENDLFIGLRLCANDVNDSQLLTGVIQDLSSPAIMFNLEASRRIGNAWKASAAALGHHAANTL